ncbi:MAG: ATP synthase F0 subunit B [Kofleriaceae bacterium]
MIRKMMMLVALVAVGAAAPAWAQHGEAEAAHGEAAHGEAAHGEAAHGEAAHGGGHHEDASKTFNFTHLMYWGKDRYGGKLGDGVEGPDNTPEQPMSAPFILMLVNFGLLLILLAKVGGPAARKMAEGRSDQIKHALDEAGALRSKAAAKLAEYETRLADADAEIAKMVEGMRADAESEKQRIAKAAADAAAAMQRDAELRIAAEIERARFELRAEVTAAAIAAAEKVLAQKTTAADQGKLFEQYLGDLQRVTAHRATTTPISKERS